MTLCHSINPAPEPETDMIKHLNWQKLINFELFEKFYFYKS